MRYRALKAVSEKLSFTLYLIGEPTIYNDDKPKWEATKNRIYLTGDWQLAIVILLKRRLPNFSEKELTHFNTLTDEGKFLVTLLIKFLRPFFKERELEVE